jgi:hypothetical protein
MHTLDPFRAEAQVEAGQRTPRHYQTQRGTGAEAIEVQRRLAGFDPQQSPINQLLKDTFPGATKNELISLAQMSMIVANRTLPDESRFLGDFDRITRRSTDLIVKWYHENWVILQNVFVDVGLADERFRPISRFYGSGLTLPN